MFHYSVSSGNKSHSCLLEASGGETLWYSLTSSTHRSARSPGNYFGPEKVTVRCVWNQCSALRVHCVFLSLSGWGKGSPGFLLKNPRKGYDQETKRASMRKVGACDGVTWRPSVVTGTGSRENCCPFITNTGKTPANCEASR